MAGARSTGEWPRPSSNPQSLLTERIDHLALEIQDREIYGQTAIQAVCSAAQSGVVGAYRHLHPVQDSLVVLAPFDELFGRLIHREIDRGVVVGRAHNQVHLRDQAVTVALIIVDQGAPGGLNATYAPARFGRNRHPDMGAGDLRVVQEFHHCFRNLQEFDQAGVVVEQGEVGRPAKGSPELLQLGLGQRALPSCRPR